jgi:hypothetical protein
VIATGFALGSIDSPVSSKKAQKDSVEDVEEDEFEAPAFLRRKK